MIEVVELENEPVTNRKWLESLSDDELAKIIYGSDIVCEVDNLKDCPYGKNLYAGLTPCERCAKRWLQKKHELE